MAWQTYTTELKLMSQNLCRYAPMMNPNKNMMFPVDGVHVGDDYMCSDKLCLVHLDNLSSESSGSYRCEVSWDLSTYYMETLNLFTCLYQFSWRFPVMRLILVSCTRQRTWRLSVSCSFLLHFLIFLISTPTPRRWTPTCTLDMLINIFLWLFSTSIRCTNTQPASEWRKIIKRNKN